LAVNPIYWTLSVVLAQKSDFVRFYAYRARFPQALLQRIQVAHARRVRENAPNRVPRTVNQKPENRNV
jgi:hypothetical protein